MDIEKDLKKLENTKFRIETITYPSNPNITGYYPQASLNGGKSWNGFFSTRNYKDSHALIAIIEYNRATMFASEKDAVEFIDYYKAWKKQEILGRPERERKLKEENEKYMEYIEEKSILEFEKNKPKIEHRYL